MKKSLLSITIIIVSLFLLTGCATNEKPVNRVTKVYETDYPKGISVVIYNSELKKNLHITDARMVYGNKRQVQLIVNNVSDDIYNISVNTKWTDQSGNIISVFPRPVNMKLQPQGGDDLVLNAPNAYARDVLVNIKCGINCIEKR